MTQIFLRGYILKLYWIFFRIQLKFSTVMSLWLVIILIHDVITVFALLHSPYGDSLLRHSGAPQRLSQKSFSLEIEPELDKLRESKAVSHVEAAPQPGTIVGTQQCLISIASASTDYVLCPFCTKQDKEDVMSVH